MAKEHNAFRLENEEQIKVKSRYSQKEIINQQKNKDIKRISNFLKNAI